MDNELISFYLLHSTATLVIIKHFVFKLFLKFKLTHWQIFNGLVENWACLYKNLKLRPSRKKTHNDWRHNLIFLIEPDLTNIWVGYNETVCTEWVGCIRQRPAWIREVSFGLCHSIITTASNWNRIKSILSNCLELKPNMMTNTLLSLFKHFILQRAQARIPNMGPSLCYHSQ